MLNCFRKNKPPKEVLVANLDYDKLAAAIVKAQQAANEELFEKDDTAYLTKGLLQWAFFAVGILLSVTSFYGAYMLFTESFSLFKCVFSIVIIVAFFFYAYIAFRMIGSISKIKDRAYLVSLFSALVAMTAMIIAIVKG